jgi:hydroxyacylglutathione hydrolase
MPLIFEQIRCGGDRNFGYLFGDRHAGTAVLIDPSYSPDVFADRAAEQHLTVTHVINTHSHPDHVNGNDRALERTGATLAAYHDFPAPPARPLADGDELAVGTLRLRIFHVPGHCPDHIVLYEPTHRVLITGDLLFVGKVGGTRTETDARVEWESLQKLIAAIPDDATVWPGHDYGVRPCSTMAMEKQTNPFLMCRDLGSFLQLKADWPSYKQRFGLK